MRGVMKRIDLRKELRHLYNPSAKEVELVRVPAFKFLMIDGRGDPNNSAEFQNAVQLLYSLSYTMKFKFKFERGIEYPVMALEGLWWMTDDAPFDWYRRKDWRWTMMIMQPNIITKSVLSKTLVEVQEKKGLEVPPSLRLEMYKEGLSAQILHIGPYSEEARTIQKLDDFAADLGLAMSAKHHEIYLSDPRRAQPRNIKAILRHPMRKRAR